MNEQSPSVPESVADEAQPQQVRQRASNAASRRTSSPPQQQEIVRPRGLPRAAVPATVPTPEHHHLPGWVRRAHGQARPILADLLGLLDGEDRATLVARLDQLTSTMSSGKFSAALQYPQLIAEGMRSLDKQRKDSVAINAQRRSLETVRRKVSDQLRDATSLNAEATARLNRALRSATDVEGVRAVEAEVGQAAGSARTSQEKRRDREIQRTRARIQSAVPHGAEEQGETWQDVLRRFADQQGGDGS